jgi:hypothetical protein
MVATWAQRKLVLRVTALLVDELSPMQCSIEEGH